MAENLPSINIDQEDIGTIMSMAGCNFSPGQIALQLGVNKKAFLKLYHDPNSEVREAYNAGVLSTKKEIIEKQKELAEGGNITAAQIFLKEAEKIEFENLKQKVFFGT